MQQSERNVHVQGEVELDESAALYVTNSFGGLAAIYLCDGPERCGSDSRAREGAEVLVASSHP